MRAVVFFFVLTLLSGALSAQYVYTIKADSVKLTNCDSSELIIENHTQDVRGFLFNTGNGRTVFKKGVIKINDSFYLIGGDTLKTPTNSWVQGGNSFGATGVLGTLDNNHLNFITNDTQRVRLSKAGNLLIGDTVDNGYRLHVKGGFFQDGGIFNKNYYTDVSSSSLKIGSGYELFGVSHSAGGYSLYLSGGVNGDFSSGWDVAFGTSTNRIMTIDHQSVNTNQPLKVNAGLVFPEQSSYMSSPYVGFQYASSSFWHWAVVNSSNVPNLVVRSNGNVVVGSTLDNGDKLQVRGNAGLIGPLNTGVRLLLGDSTINNALGIRSYGDTSGGNNNHYAAIGLNLGESASAYNVSKGGGGIYLDDRAGVQPIRFMIRSPGSSLSATPAGSVTNSGNFLMGTTTDNGNKLQVNGSSLFTGKMYVNANSGDGTGQIFVQSSAGDYSNFIGSSQYNMLFQTRQTGQSFLFQFGGASHALIMQGNNGGNAVLTSTGSFNIVAVDSINGGSSGSIHLSSNNYSNSDGVVVERGTRSIVMTDPIFTIREKDTTVFNAQKNGFIGIGLSTPSAQLHTTGTVRFAGLTSDTTKTRVLVSDASGNLYYRDASTLADNGLLSSDLASGRAILPSLAINGTITAQRMKLSQAGWPDYVFSRGYALPALPEIEQYIQEHGHLPGMPSAAEVEKKGVDVGDHQAALLKKVEELTLYSIEQNKKLAAQRDELDGLKKEMAELKKMVSDRVLK